MIVGTNRLKAYRTPSQPIYVIMPVYVFQSLTTCHTYAALKSSCFELPCLSAASLRRTLRRSSSVRNLASSGKSWTIQKDAIPMTIVARPSRINIHAQPGFPPTPSIFAMAAARSPPKDPAKAAAEKNTAERMPNSLLLYLNASHSMKPT